MGSLLDHPDVDAALWGTRPPDQLDAIERVFGWHADGSRFVAIDTILRHNLPDPVGPLFMALPTRKVLQGRTTPV